eukprot:305984-Ditylum_brightwellii.AAC.1
MLTLHKTTLEELLLEEFKKVVGRLFQTIETAVEFEDTTLFELDWKTHFIQMLPTLGHGDVHNNVNSRLDKCRDVVNLCRGKVQNDGENEEHPD